MAIPSITSVPNHEAHSLRILDAIELGHCASQRSLASELGIALGLTNLLVKRLVRKGWVRATHVTSNRVRYLITPAGIAEKTKMSRAYFDSSVEFYRHTRNRIRQQFSVLSACWPARETPGAPKRIVFYGAGEVAEIGYVCLIETDLTLAGVADPVPSKPFFGYPVHSPADFSGMTLDGRAFEQLVVMSFRNPDDLWAEMVDCRVGVPFDRVFWL